MRQTLMRQTLMRQTLVRLTLGVQLHVRQILVWKTFVHQPPSQANTYAENNCAENIYEANNCTANNCAANIADKTFVANICAANPI